MRVFYLHHRWNDEIFILTASSERAEEWKNRSGDHLVNEVYVQDCNLRSRSERANP